ncbi:CAP domain-containing protein [Ginsengibacter hankyongi]|uniref:CAP domain-containing protein n=1 Tax=Ginsengibacter hankyongi TaxID=2607284 RepID=A0A5J5IFV6_9BACT|nr:CAP domain-containing protein [Ginsengibacter hankyongi]KAA9036533.1 CAP domain-containing protein [Ginsengibacter hankyongi]
MKRIFVYVTVICLSLFVSLTSFPRNKSSNPVQDILNQTNQFRRSQGLNNLIIMKGLNAIARKHSEDMASGRIGFGHEGFDKRNAMANKVIKHMHDFAENVAYGPTTGTAVVNLWKNSPGHRRNMLGHYKYIGIGIAKDRQGRIYYTQVFAG